MSEKDRVWEILEPAKANDKTSRFFDIFISCVIVIAVTALVLESEPSLNNLYSNVFLWVEYICLAIFVPEYLLRLWSCKASPDYRRRWGRLRWIFSPMALIDLAAILPSLFMFTVVDMRFLRTIRLLRLLKLGRYNRGMKMIVATLKACGRQLLVVMSGELVLLLISACILYYTEREAQPDAFGSIPRAMWWSVCTLTTVGYGDIYPVTALGKFLSGIISILGISAFALPTGIIAANFESIMERAGGITCPNCGEKLQ